MIFFLLVIIFLLTFLPVSSFAVSKVIREKTVAEIPLESGIDPIAFLIDPANRPIVLDRQQAALIFFDKEGKISRRISLIKIPELSTFDLRDFCRIKDNYFVLENHRRKILIYRDDRKIGEIPLPVECVEPIRISSTMDGMLCLYDGSTSKTLFLDLRGKVVHITKQPRSLHAEPMRRHFTWQMIENKDRVVTFSHSFSFNGPFDKLYTLSMPSAIEGIDLYGEDSQGELYLRINCSYATSQKSWLLAISEKGIRRFQLPLLHFSDCPLARSIQLSPRGELFALRKYPQKYLITTLLIERSWE